jgi:hypothetical protein
MVNNLGAQEGPPQENFHDDAMQGAAFSLLLMLQVPLAAFSKTSGLEEAADLALASCPACRCELR